MTQTQTKISKTTLEAPAEADSLLLNEQQPNIGKQQKPLEIQHYKKTLKNSRF